MDEARETSEEVVIFRPMAGTDLDQVVDNEMRSYAFPWTRGVFADCLKSAYECWVVQTGGGELIGHGILSVGAGEAHLLNICIRRDRQGEGHGRALLHHMLDCARLRRAHVVFLEVRPSNRVAMTLYRSLGFEPVGRRPGYYPADRGVEDAQVMALTLA